MSEDEDDPVVQEIPVYLSHSLADNLYMYQYPVIPAAISSDKCKILKSRIKPEHQEVALEVAIDMNNTNYDSSHGEMIAKSIDKEKPPEARTYPRKIMDRLHLESNRAVLDTNSYCVGVMQGKELHLTPLKGIVSMIPNFLHLNQQKAENEDVVEEKLVRLDLAGDAERAKKSTRANYNIFSRQVAQEPWFTTEFYDIDTPKAQLERSRLISCTNRESLTLSRAGYLDWLVPKEKSNGEEGGANVPLPDRVLSLSVLRQLPLQERVRVTLTEVTAVPLSQLTWVVGPTDQQRVLGCVQQIAVLVQGNWVLRSDLLYPKDTFSPHNGVPAEAMARARDYILHQLNEGKVLERKNLASIVKIPNEELKDIMSRVAILRKNQNWHFRLSPDHEFLTKYPSVVEQQKLLWEAKYNQLVEALSIGAPPAAPARRKRDASAASGSESASRRRKNSSVGSDGECGANTEGDAAGMTLAMAATSAGKGRKKKVPPAVASTGKASGGAKAEPSQTKGRQKKRNEIQVNGECVVKVERNEEDKIVKSNATSKAQKPNMAT